MRLGALSLGDGPAVILAPMAGVTDAPFRVLAHEFGCPMAYSEMVSAVGINYRNAHTLKMLRTTPAERPMAMQLFGRDPAMLARAASFVQELGVADAIDFNLGCPAPKIARGGAGSALLKEPQRVTEILTALRRVVTLPLTVKMRLGWDAGHIVALEVARRAEAAGADAIAVHGRTREQFYSGRADWEAIAAVKRAVSVPVIGNGDVRTVDDLQRMLDATGCDGVMVGRAAQGNPWLFRQLTTYLRTGRRTDGPTPSERAEIIMRHLDMLVAVDGELGLREMRKHAAWYTRGLPGSARLRDAFNRAATRDDFQKLVDTLTD